MVLRPYRNAAFKTAIRLLRTSELRIRPLAVFDKTMSNPMEAGERLCVDKAGPGIPEHFLAQGEWRYDACSSIIEKEEFTACRIECQGSG